MNVKHFLLHCYPIGKRCSHAKYQRKCHPPILFTEGGIIMHIMTQCYVQIENEWLFSPLIFPLNVWSWQGESRLLWQHLAAISASSLLVYNATSLAHVALSTWTGTVGGRPVGLGSLSCVVSALCSVSLPCTKVNHQVLRALGQPTPPCWSRSLLLYSPSLPGINPNRLWFVFHPHDASFWPLSQKAETGVVQGWMFVSVWLGRQPGEESSFFTPLPVKNYGPLCSGGSSMQQKCFVVFPGYMSKHNPVSMLCRQLLPPHGLFLALIYIASCEFSLNHIPISWLYQRWTPIISQRMSTWVKAQGLTTCASGIF